MRYVWDRAKDSLNRRKHGLSLAEGIPALEDPERESWIDGRYDYGEERIGTLGMGKRKYSTWFQRSGMRTAPGSSR